MLLNPIFKNTLTALLLTLFLSSVFSTASAAKGKKGPHRGKPPEAAFTACADQSEESACSFNTPDGDTIEGTCMVPRKSEESLVCKPSRGEREGRPQRKRD